jgi:hypothetical protein
MKKAILSSAYFGPIQYYSKLFRYDEIGMERYDNYVKQTYRNRCVIMTTNGPQSLTIPIEGFDGAKCLMRDIRISDHGNWRHLHLNALESAYGVSPYYEFYIDDIRPFFERHWDYLYDFNMEICMKMCDLIDIHPNIIRTDQYMKSEEVDDFRDSIRPKHPLPDASFTSRPYYQVYQQKYGFVENLSILDLLFNMGPEGIFYL